VLCEGQDALYVDFLEPRIFEFDPDDCDVLAHLVALTPVRRRVDAPFVQKGILEQCLTPLELCKPALQALPQIPSISAPHLPDVQDNRTK
jgi:hypothetical protein